jgi:hypothetical protein
MTKCLLLKTEDRKVKRDLSGGWYQWEGEGYKETVVVEHGGNYVLV